MKIGIIGAGSVGASAAYLLVAQGLAREIALVDIAENVAKARAIDVAQAACVFGLDASVEGGSDYEALRCANVVVITAGLARKAGQSRDDLASANAAIVAHAAREAAKYAPNSVIITVTNPLDLMTFVAWQASGFEEGRVLGMAGELDAARLKFEIREATGGIVSNLNGVVCVGLHGDGMVFPSSNLNNISNLNELKARAERGGARIVELAGSSAFYAPAAGIVKTCRALASEGEKLCCCVVVEGVAMGREVIIAKGGVKQILTSNLSQAEAAQMSENEAKIRAQISNLKF